MNEPKFPDVKVRLTGTNGNVFALAGRVSEAMRKAKVDPAEIKAFSRALFQCEDYDAALRLMCNTVSVS